MERSKRLLDLLHALSFVFLICFFVFFPSVHAEITAVSSCASDRDQKANGDGSKWSIAKPSAENEWLLKNIDYSCSQKGVSCRDIQPDGTCYRPNILVSHSSYAMNLFYKISGEHPWDCHFNGTGIVITQNPSVGGCVYPL